MLYLDTSVIVALLTQEAGSAAAEQQLDDWLLSGRQAVCSDWAAAEFNCAIAAKHRYGAIHLHDLPFVAEQLAGLRAEKLASAQLLPTDVIRAGELAIAKPAMKLRAGDALHLAIAARLGVTHFLSFDHDQAEAARQILVGVKVLP